MSPSNVQNWTEEIREIVTCMLVCKIHNEREFSLYLYAIIILTASNNLFTINSGCQKNLCMHYNILFWLWIDFVAQI